VLESHHRLLNFRENITEIEHSKYARYVFFAAALYAIAAVGDKIILRHMTPESYMFFMHFFIVFDLLVLNIIKGYNLKGVELGIRSFGPWIFASGVLILMSRYSLMTALSMADLSLVAPLKSMGVLFSVIFGGTLFHEHQIPKKLFASVMMIAGAYLVVI